MDLRLLRPPRKITDWVLLAFGLWFLGTAGYGLVMGSLSLAWPKVNGVVTYSQSTHPRRGPDQVDIRYRFSMAGHEYTGDRWRYLFVMVRSVSLKPWYVQTAQASYPVGQSVRVSVSPSDPSNSVLEAGPSMDNVFWTFAGVILVIYVVAPWPQARHEGRRPWAGGTGLIVLAGFAVLAYGLYSMYHGVASGFWPTTPGKVLYSQIYVSGSGNLTLGEVRYEYELDGTRLLGDHIQGGSKELAHAWVKANRVGDGITVHYNPLDPADSEVLPGIGWRDFILPGIGLAVLAWAVVLRKAAIATERWEEEREAARLRA